MSFLVMVHFKLNMFNELETMLFWVNWMNNTLAGWVHFLPGTVIETFQYYSCNKQLFLNRTLNLNEIPFVLFQKKVDPFVSTMHLPHPFRSDNNRIVVFTEVGTSLWIPYYIKQYRCHWTSLIRIYSSISGGCSVYIH